MLEEIVPMKIHESAENYLETILVLKRSLGKVRSIDIAGELEFSKPSVSVAMKKLRENGYIEMDSEGFISRWIQTAGSSWNPREKPLPQKSWSDMS